MKSIFQTLPQVILAEFDSAHSLVSAAKKLREAGYTKYDSHSPFPVHGMDDAMGLKRSPLGYVVGVMGFTGMIGMIALTYWTSAVDYRFVISGKPYFSWQAFVPVIFAITVLFSALGAFFGMLAFNQLPRLFHPVFNSEKFSRVTDGGFFISVQADDPLYDRGKVISFLESIGGRNVEVVDADEK
ncbi:MAG: DUF3341 domain-containing protein [Candidatus Zixiibacteriota bacterium]|nr:MAG: DUF3341 domain-containing protein [candidate division Zixibacteria bacterium]